MKKLYMDVRQRINHVMMEQTMYKLYCSKCENRFTISDEIFNNFLEDDNALMKCPNCQSIEVNILEVEGQRAGY